MATSSAPSGDALTRPRESRSTPRMRFPWMGNAIRRRATSSRIRLSSRPLLFLSERTYRKVRDTREPSVRLVIFKGRVCLFDAWGLRVGVPAWTQRAFWLARLLREVISDSEKPKLLFSLLFFFFLGIYFLVIRLQSFGCICCIWLEYYLLRYVVMSTSSQRRVLPN